MTPENFEREKSYEAVMALLISMHKIGFLTGAELAEADAELREKYRPMLGLLRPLNP